jgi:hypothetical protein
MMMTVLPNCGEETSVEPQPTNSEPPNMTLFDMVVFYDGYAERVTELHHEGIKRLSNSSYVTKLLKSEIEAIGDTLELEIIIEPACDNYDRIGNVFLTLIEKGYPYHEDIVVSQIELARFITPFMDKNKYPNEVPYYFDISNIAEYLRDTNISDTYDFWIEFRVFGVPYAAQAQVAGCAGRIDVFIGTLKLNSSGKHTSKAAQQIIPLASFASLNNSNNSDIPGQTVRIFNADVKSPMTNVKMYVITSNHGANAGGEEYNRRTHNIYFDDKLIATYKPGGKSCEPYRQYNTQSNGIYGPTPRPESDWTSWNNWCPGDKIPIRVYPLEDLAVGTHTFKIEVPDAEFVNGEGNIPVSVYIQGDM